jgi:hypothetical protein
MYTKLEKSKRICIQIEGEAATVEWRAVLKTVGH